ncbi:uncharacterized protein LOC123264767 isoform X1 [Cotesia glomerata]|uniref:uncharacterized protein LOC123264767 isoform X1 n=2 Tax=Cotesia glomerata TaxID=32391 RepID=UPI001D0088AF|nr:uncharacterized protein LOC123264767 isoform X1 [Cotesia glomerata]
MYSSNPFKFVEYVTNSAVLPKCRTEPILYCDGENLYSFSVHHLNLMVFNLQTRLWRYMYEGRCLILRMNSLVGVAFHGRKLIILTFMESLLDRTSHMQTFDLDKETMVVTPLTGDIPLSTKPFNFIIHDHYYYTVGAIRDHKEYSDVYRLNTTTFKWESVYKCTGLDRNEPKRRRGHTLVYDGSKIYIFRETLNFSYVVGKAEAVDNFQKLPAFDLTTRKWTSVETYGDKKHKPRYPKNNRGAFALTQYTDPVYYRFLLIFIQCMLLRKDSCLCTEDSVIKILGVERTVSRVLQQYTALG